MKKEHNMNRLLMPIGLILILILLLALVVNQVFLPVIQSEPTTTATPSGIKANVEIDPAREWVLIPLSPKKDNREKGK